MAKTLCDWKKNEIESKAAKLAALVDSPTHYCRKCARCANDKKVLCKARELPEPEEKSRKGAQTTPKEADQTFA